MKNQLLPTILFSILFSLSNPLLGHEKPSHRAVAEKSSSIIKLPSKFVPGGISLTVSLPKHYNRETSNRYPVLFQLDGEVFASHHCSVLDGLALTDEIPQLIYIGIDTPNRGLFFYPPADRNKADGVKVLILALRNEAIPYVEKTYRTIPFRILSGHSAGGIATYETFIAEPELFNAYFAFDAALGAWEDESFKPDFSRHQSITGLRFFYANRQAKDLQKDAFRSFEIYDAYFKKNLPRTVTYQTRLEEGSSHIAVHLTGIVFALKALFWEYVLKPDDVEKIRSLQDLQNYYRNLSLRLGFEIPITKDAAFQTTIRHYLESSDHENTLIFAKYWIEHYPDVGSYTTMGSVLEKMGKMKEAQSYKLKACLEGKNHEDQRWGQVWDEVKNLCMGKR